MTIYASNALRPIAGNYYLPDSMEAKGRPVPIAPFPGTTNGIGELVRAGQYGLDWTFPFLFKSDLDWWANLVGYVYGYKFANISKRFETLALPAARVWDISGNLIDYAVAVIYMPSWTEYRNGYFHNCVVKFRNLEEAD